MKTPMQELIEKITEHTWYDEVGDAHVNLDIINLSYFIEKEKQMIIDAYDMGFNSYYTTERTAEQYYNETFKQ